MIGDGLLLLEGRRVRRRGVFERHEGRRVAGEFERLGDDQGNGLPAEMDLVVVEGPERRARRGDFIVVTAVEPGERRPVLVREDLDHPGELQDLSGVDRLDLSPSNGTRNDIPVEQVQNLGLGGVLRLAGDFGAAVDAAERSADVGRIRRHDEGLPRPAACVRARTITRRDSSILKVL